MISNPAWKHRRRIVYATVGVALAMLVVGGLDWTDRQVSSQLVMGAVTLLSIVITAYTGFATLDDRWQEAKYERELPDLFEADGGPGGSGLGGDPGSALRG